MKTKTFGNTRALAVAAVAALCLSSGVVYAGDATEGIPTRTVRYSDLDLGTQAGVTALYNRIRQAAQEVCGDPISRQLAEAAAAKACMARAISTSVHAVHNARLASVYDSHLRGGKVNGASAMR